MPANATLEFASAVAGANGRWQRFDYRTRRRVRGQSRRCLSGGGRRRRSHKRKAERALRDPSAVVASSVDAHSDAHPAPRRGVPRGVCLDARRGERALRDSADLLEALHMPFDLNISNFKLDKLAPQREKQFRDQSAHRDEFRRLLPRLRVLAAPNHSGWSSSQGESPHWSGEARGRQPRYVRHPRRVFRLRPSRPIRQVSRRPSHRRSSGR